MAASIPDIPRIAPVHRCELGADVQARLWQWDHRFALAGRAAAHPQLELAWIESGRVHYRLGAHATTLDAGGAIVVPAGVEHVTTFDGAMRGCALHVGPGRVAEVADAMGVRATGVEAGLLARPDAVVGLGALLARELAGAARGHLIAAEALAEALTVTLLRAAGERARAQAPQLASGAVHPRVRKALLRIEAEYAEPLTVEQLAREVGMTRFAFTRLFREQVGTPPYQYLLTLRLERAAERLRGGRQSVTEVAIAVGLPDLGRFSRMFRRRFGCAPREMAASARLARRSA